MIYRVKSVLKTFREYSHYQDFDYSIKISLNFLSWSPLYCEKQEKSIWFATSGYVALSKSRCKDQKVWFSTPLTFWKWEVSDWNLIQKNIRPVVMQKHSLQIPDKAIVNSLRLKFRSESLFIEPLVFFALWSLWGKDPNSWYFNRYCF